MTRKIVQKKPPVFLAILYTGKNREDFKNLNGVHLLYGGGIQYVAAGYHESDIARWRTLRKGLWLIRCQKPGTYLSLSQEDFDSGYVEVTPDSPTESTPP